MQALLGPARVAEWRRLSPQDWLKMLLGDRWWGTHAQTGDERMQLYLVELEKARRWAGSAPTYPNTHTTRRREGPWLRLRLVHNDNYCYDRPSHPGPLAKGGL